ncbi:MAG TPA: Rrf2 family transcriptional regulator [Solirubrobacteraceae bacterium]|nr:Rrf2 family transcriptional regulator [Solirubrobacteraceae bacterium]
MMFSTKAEYGVRVMVELARRAARSPGETNAVVPLAEIAEHDNLPLAYLEHVVARLRKAGLVSSRRGSRGGYLLARAPEQITMAEVVIALEGSIAPIECISEQSDGSIVCSRESDPGHVCPTKLLWTRVHASIVGTLRDTTLADLLAGAVAPAAPNQLIPTTLVADALRSRALTPIEPMTTGA